MTDFIEIIQTILRKDEKILCLPTKKPSQMVSNNLLI